MPTYEFECKACKVAFEELVFGDEKVACPSCDSKRVARRVTSFSMGAAGGTGRGTIPSDILDAARISSGGNVPGGACGPCGDPAGPGSC